MINKEFGDYTKMLQEIIEGLRAIGIEVPAVCDHICYRVKTDDEYEKTKISFLSYGTLAGETLVRGRKIAIIELTNEIIFEDFKISCVELPAPKEGSPYKTGWEHAEFVVKDLGQFISKYDSIEFNAKSMVQDINPELTYKINDSYRVKFHPLHILEVLKKELQMGIVSVT